MRVGEDSKVHEGVVHFLSIPFEESSFEAVFACSVRSTTSLPQSSMSARLVAGVRFVELIASVELVVQQMNPSTPLPSQLGPHESIEGSLSRS